MWTKQYTAAGMPFYYNATQNKSLWMPPPSDLIHEAEYLKIPDKHAEPEINKYEARPPLIEQTMSTPIPVPEYQVLNPNSVIVDVQPKP
jgi:hypothetical protein